MVKDILQCIKMLVRAICSSMVEHPLMVRWVVGSIPQKYIFTFLPLQDFLVWTDDLVYQDLRGRRGSQDFLENQGGASQGWGGRPVDQDWMEFQEPREKLDPRVCLARLGTQNRDGRDHLAPRETRDSQDFLVCKDGMVNQDSPDWKVNVL